MTDPGLVRENNEDSMAIEGPFFVVADGLGGLPEGEVASQAAVQKLISLYKGLKKFPGKDWLREAFLEANRIIFGFNSGRTQAERMATTLTASLFHKQKIFIGHVGDCRVLQIRKGRSSWLTTDHSTGRHSLTRCIGFSPDVEVDVYESDTESGDIYVQCSDGLHSVVSQDEITRTAQKYPPKETCEKLVGLANHYGGPDNITLQVVRVQ